MEKMKAQVNNWENTGIQVFWGEIAPCDHSIQIYENDTVFLNTLEGFAGCGFLSGDSVVIIATTEHLEKLNDRLRTQGFDLEALIENEQYFPLEARDTLSKFMVKNWPDEKLFEKCISGLIARASKNGRKIRAFGEMVAVLWENGLHGATVQLEHLWNQLHEKEAFTLYCAYPKTGFSQTISHSIDTICKAHSKIIDGQTRPATEIYYRTSK